MLLIQSSIKLAGGVGSRSYMTVPQTMLTFRVLPNPSSSHPAIKKPAHADFTIRSSVQDKLLLAPSPNFVRTPHKIIPLPTASRQTRATKNSKRHHLTYCLILLS